MSSSIVFGTTTTEVSHLYREIFESRRIDMVAANQWPKDKPLPDPEQYLACSMLDATLKDMNYVPTKIEPTKK